MGLQKPALPSISYAMLIKSNSVETVDHGLPDTCPGDTVMRMRIVMASPRGWCNVTLLYKPFLLHYQAEISALLRIWYEYARGKIIFKKIYLAR